MSDYDATTDEELTAILRAAAARIDPVPSTVRAAARAGASFASSTNWDAELAVLTYDSLLDDNDLRAVRARGVRQLTFEGPHLTVELQVRAGRRDSPREVEGQLVPAQGAHIEIRSPQGTVPVETGPRGHFRAVATPGGPVSVRCVADDDTATHTEWVVI